MFRHKYSSGCMKLLSMWQNASSNWQDPDGGKPRISARLCSAGNRLLAEHSHTTDVMWHVYACDMGRAASRKWAEIDHCHSLTHAISVPPSSPGSAMRALHMTQPCILHSTRQSRDTVVHRLPQNAMYTLKLFANGELQRTCQTQHTSNKFPT